MLHKDLIIYFKTNLKFKELCIDMLSRQYAFSIEQTSAYKDILNFTESHLMYNHNIVWDLKTIKKTKDKIDWEGFYKVKGIDLNLSFFKEYENVISFRTISLNHHLDWSNELLDTYAERWDWNSLMGKSIAANPRNIAKYIDKYNWDKFSSNRYLNLNEDLVETYKDRWNWTKLCRNSNFKLNKNGIKKHKDKLCFKSLSANETMVPFILAYPNDYEWNWNSFILNHGVVFSDKLIQFLVTKLKRDLTLLKQAPAEVQNNFVKSNMLSVACRSFNFDRTIWFSEEFKNNIPWKKIIAVRPEVLTSNEIETYLHFDDFDKILPFHITQKLSKEYIIKNKEALLKFRWSIFRYAAIDEEFVMANSIETDWFQLAFNSQFNWSIKFLTTKLDKFDSLYGLSQNETLFNTLFGEATNEEIDKLLDNY